MIELSQHRPSGRHIINPSDTIHHAPRDTPRSKPLYPPDTLIARYLVPKELFSSAPFRCLARRQGRLRTQNPKSESKNQTQARSHAALQPHWNFKSGWRNAENTTRKETNGRSVYNPPATIKKDSANGEKELGKCKVCPQPVIPGQTRCPSCAAKQRQHNDNATAKRRAARTAAQQIESGASLPPGSHQD